MFFPLNLHTDNVTMDRDCKLGPLKSIHYTIYFAARMYTLIVELDGLIIIA